MPSIWYELRLKNVDVRKVAEETGLKPRLIRQAFDQPWIDMFDTYRGETELGDRRSERHQMSTRLDACETWQDAKQVLLDYDHNKHPPSEKDMATRLLCVVRIASFFPKSNSRSGRAAA